MSSVDLAVYLASFGVGVLIMLRVLASPPGYCTLCGEPLRETRWRSGFDQRTGAEQFRSVWRCSNLTHPRRRPDADEE